MALVGATGNTKKGGNRILINLTKGFHGPIHPVNPRYSEINGVKCYPSIGDVPDPVDLAIVFIPAAGVPGIISACAARGIKGVIIESAGFAEVGDHGKKLQEDVLEIARKTGIRIWGPNCMGLIDPKNTHVFSFCTPAIWDVGLTPGDVSMIVQSGLLSAGFILDGMSHGTLFPGKVCSIGNKLDVDESDILEYLIGDPETKAIALYLESIKDGHRFLDLCRGSAKPIVVLKGGKSPHGAKAALSHTASLAGNGAVVSGALAQAGVIEAYDFKQMTDIGKALAMYSDLHDFQDRIAVLTYSGAAGIVSTDLIHKSGLKIADLSPDTKDKIGSLFPEWMPLGNPVDMWPAIELHGYQKVFETSLMASALDPEVDAILFHAFVGASDAINDYSRMIKSVHDAGKPVFCWLLGKREEAAQTQSLLEGLGVPVYKELSTAVEAIAAVLKYSKNKITETEGDHISVKPSLTESNLEFSHTDNVMDEYMSKQILSKCGIPVVKEITVSSLDEALRTVREWGFPVVMKGILPGEVHKTEHGLVHLGISSETALQNAFDALLRQLPADGQILLQPHIPGQIELIAGFLHDPQFGPCVMAGLGGVMAEILDDTAFALAPLTHEDAMNMLACLKNQRLLNGFRGSRPVDRDHLARILVSLGRLGDDYSRIHSIDINPIIINNGLPIVVDASIILHSSHG